MEESEIHLWWFDLRLPPESLAECEAVLGEDERVRAAKFRFERHRVRYIAAHCQVRRILSRCVGRPPETLEFRVGAYGKPSLGGTDLEFNLSHSHEVGLCAVTRGRAIGVDVEQCRENVSNLEIARRFFMEAEVARLEVLDEVDRRRVFFRIWTAKEAFMKATGHGFSRSPSSFEVEFGSGDRIFGVRSEPGWSLIELEDAPEGFAATVCVKGGIPALRRMEA